MENATKFLFGSIGFLCISIGASLFLLSNAASRNAVQSDTLRVYKEGYKGGYEDGAKDMLDITAKLEQIKPFGTIPTTPLMPETNKDIFGDFTKPLPKKIS